MRKIVTFFFVASAAAAVLGDPLPLKNAAEVSPELKSEIKIVDTLKETTGSTSEPGSIFEEEGENEDDEKFGDEEWTVTYGPEVSPVPDDNDEPDSGSPSSGPAADDGSLISGVLNKKKPTKQPKTPRPIRTTRPPKPTTPAELILVLQWPITFSKEKGNRQVDTGKVKPGPGDATWTIHGLWPNNVKCTKGKPLKSTDLTPSTQKDLARAWPTYAAGQSDFRFWDYEWKKHGACSGLAPEAYFTLARDHWAKHHQIYDWLKAKNITPHDGNAYNTADLINAIIGGSGGLAKNQFALSCISRNGQKWLKEFKVCFEPAGKRLTGCPRNIASNTSGCGKAVHYFENF